MALLHAIGICPICTYRSGRSSRHLPASLYALHDALMTMTAVAASSSSSTSAASEVAKLLAALAALDVGGLDLDETHAALFALLVEVVQVVSGRIRGEGEGDRKGRGMREGEWVAKLEGRVQVLGGVLGASQGWYLEETVERARVEGRELVRAVVEWGIGALRGVLGEEEGAGGADGGTVELDGWVEGLLDRNSEVWEWMDEN